MLELMNMVILEANARRRVEVIGDEMRAARARGSQSQEASQDPGSRTLSAPRQRPRETGRGGAGDAPAATCGMQPLPGA